MVSRAKCTYIASDVPAWVGDEAVKSAFPELAEVLNPKKGALADLVLMSAGWAVRPGRSNLWLSGFVAWPSTDPAKLPLRECWGEAGAMNHLEQLVAEWYEFRGYFVRRNVAVGKRPNGGYDCELDVVAFCPTRHHLVHLEPSMDAHTWAVREKRYAKKFEAGRKHIPGLFGKNITLPDAIEQIAVLGFASNANVKALAGGRIQTTAELLAEITAELAPRKIASAAVPEQYPLLRTIQFAYQHRKAAGW